MPTVERHSTPTADKLIAGFYKSNKHLHIQEHFTVVTVHGQSTAVKTPPPK